MKKLIWVLAVVFAVSLTGKAMVWASEGTTNASTAAKVEKKAAKPKVKKAVKALYTCPMHPEVTSDKPGKCPKCGMDLVKVEKKSSGKKQGTDKGVKKMDSAKAYTCPMCHVDAGKPGKCPMCGMDMVEKPLDMKKHPGDAEKM